MSKYTEHVRVKLKFLLKDEKYQMYIKSNILIETNLASCTCILICKNHKFYKVTTVITVHMSVQSLYMNILCNYCTDTL